MRVIVCEDERFFQKSICEQIDQWIHKTHHEDVNVTLFSSSEDLLDGWQKGIDGEILFIEVQSPYVLIYMQSKKEPIKIRYRFLDLIPKLPEELFTLCHRSYLVNIVHVRAVRRNMLTLSTGQELPVSRSFAEHLNNVFDSYYQEGGMEHGMDNL